MRDKCIAAYFVPTTSDDVLFFTPEKIRDCRQ
jgi:hypothetical protein